MKITINKMNKMFMLILLQLATLHSINCQFQNSIDDSHTTDLGHMLNKCKLESPNFDKCMKSAFNEMRVFFRTGIPELRIKPFDPHRCGYVEARRGDPNSFGGFALILRNVSEFGWSDSKVTSFKFVPQEQKIVYSQYFGDKSLVGEYDVSGSLMGAPMKNAGIWNLTLSDYSQTTTVRRVGGPGSLLKVHVVVDHIGDMSLHISNFFGRDRQSLNSVTDNVINSMWQLGLPFIRPLINELVSTAFTDIFNESFRYFPLDSFIS